MTSLDRRQLMKVGGMGCATAVMGALAKRPVAAASDNTPLPPIRSCILVFHYGGPSHLDTVDPKPYAPDGIRGEYKTIATAVPGIRVSEHLPEIAQRMERVTLIRSMHHRMTNHNAAAAEGLTGRTPAGGDQELLSDDTHGFPAMGSAVAYGLGARAHLLPYVALPYTIYNVVQIPGQTAGFLGGASDRFQVNGNPATPNFAIPSLELPVGRRAADLELRQDLLKLIEPAPDLELGKRIQILQSRALELISTDSIRHGFNIDAESPDTRDRYGRNLLGQSLLLARRLVESGVNFVTVFDGQHNGQDANWDSHLNVFPRHRQLIPPADLGISALIDDLDSRGLLESTLIISMGEFGRTPKINGQAGRDHWPNCYSILMAGGGVKRGHVHGSSDRIGAFPAVDPVTPADLATTILWRFGIDPSREIRDQTGRPSRLGDGQVLSMLFA